MTNLDNEIFNDSIYFVNMKKKIDKLIDNSKKFKVYHTKNWALNTKLHFIDSPDFVEKYAPEFKDGYKPFKSNYKHVANVTCEEYGQTFQLTNHIEEAWWENKEVELIEESRSTSVGDLVEDSNGKLWMVAGIGFMEVEWSNDDDPNEVYTDEYGSYIVPKRKCTDCGSYVENDDIYCPNCYKVFADRAISFVKNNR